MLIPIVLFLFLLSCGNEKEQLLLTVVEKGKSSVGFYTPEGKRIAGAKVDTFPHEMRFSSDRKYAYVTNNGSLRYTDTVEGGETVSVINLQTLQTEEPIRLHPYRRPHGIDLDPESGLLAVGVENPDRVLLVDPKKRKILKEFDNHGKTPHMVRLSKGARWIYASNVQSASVTGIHTGTGEFFSIPVGFKPQEAELSPDERILYVGCDQYIAVIDLTTREEVAQIPNGSNRMELIKNGEILVFASTKFGVGFADARSYQMIHHIDLPYKPYSLHVSDDEKLAFVSAEEQDIVYTVDVERMEILDQFRTPEGTRPDPVMMFNYSNQTLFQ